MSLGWSLHPMFKLIFLEVSRSAPDEPAEAALAFGYSAAVSLVALAVYRGLWRISRDLRSSQSTADADYTAADADDGVFDAGGF